MTDEMIAFYKELNTNEKRNELSSLLLKLDQLINELMLQNNFDFTDFSSVKNYDSMNQAIQTEDDALLFFYDDIWTIKTKILALLSQNK